MTRVFLAAAIARLAQAAPAGTDAARVNLATMQAIVLCDNLEPLALGTLYKFADGSYLYVGRRDGGANAEDFAASFVPGDGYAEGEWPDVLQVVAFLDPIRRSMNGAIGFCTVHRYELQARRHPAAAAGDQFNDVIGDVRREIAQRRDACTEIGCPWCDPFGDVRHDKAQVQ